MLYVANHHPQALSGTYSIRELSRAQTATLLRVQNWESRLRFKMTAEHATGVAGRLIPLNNDLLFAHPGDYVLLIQPTENRDPLKPIDPGIWSYYLIAYHRPSQSNADADREFYELLAGIAPIETLAERAAIAAHATLVNFAIDGCPPPDTSRAWPDLEEDDRTIIRAVADAVANVLAGLPARTLLTIRHTPLYPEPELHTQRRTEGAPS